MGTVTKRRLRVGLEVTVRPITEPDLSGLTEWYGPERDDGFRASFEKHRNGQAWYLVAVGEGDTVVGHLGADLVALDHPVLWQMGVAPAVRGLGIGSAMLDVAEDEMRRRGFDVVEIRAELDNPRARALYERQGYAVTDEVNGEWIMRKSLYP